MYTFFKMFLGCCAYATAMPYKLIKYCTWGVKPRRHVVGTNNFVLYVVQALGAGLGALPNKIKALKSKKNKRE